MRYLAPFNILRRDLMSSSAALTEEQVLAILPIILRPVSVDESWYLDTYPDVAEAIAAGHIKSAREHFISDGYKEGRPPFEHEIDETWYVKTYPDIVELIKSGQTTPEQHYAQHGYVEGRLPGNPQEIAS
jgi:hypothetical protein